MNSPATIFGTRFYSVFPLSISQCKAGGLLAATGNSWSRSGKTLNHAARIAPRPISTARSRYRRFTRSVSFYDMEGTQYE